MAETLKEQHSVKLHAALERIRANTGLTICNRQSVTTETYTLDANAPRAVIAMNPLIESIGEMTMAHMDAQHLFHFSTRAGVCWIFASGSTHVFSGTLERDGRPSDAIVMQHDPAGPPTQYACVTMLSPRMCAACESMLGRSFKCARCRKRNAHVRYCSRGCQEAHWPLHRTVCGRMQSMQPVQTGLR